MILNHCNVVPKNCWIFQKQNWWCNEKWGDLLGIGLVIGRIIPIESQLFIESSFWGLMLAAHIITSWNSSQYWKLVMIRKKLRRRHTTIGFMSILRGRMEYPSQFACQTGEVKKVQPYDWCYYCMTHLLMNTKSIIGAIFHHEKKYVHFKVCYDIVDVIGIILKCPPSMMSFSRYVLFGVVLIIKLKNVQFLIKFCGFINQVEAASVVWWWWFLHVMMFIKHYTLRGVRLPPSSLHFQTHFLLDTLSISYYSVLLWFNSKFSRLHCVLKSE